MNDRQKPTRLAPLVEELAAFWRGHGQGAGGLAAAQMEARVRELWPDIPEARISDEPDPEEDVDLLALRIAADIGETARRLIELDEAEALGWSRANLIFDLRRYRTAIGNN